MRLRIFFDRGIRGWMVKLLLNGGAGTIGGWTAYLGHRVLVFDTFRLIEWAEKPIAAGVTRNAHKVPLVAH
jgi:hypothetical protein